MKCRRYTSRSRISQTGRNMFDHATVYAEERNSGSHTIEGLMSLFWKGRGLPSADTCSASFLLRKPSGSCASSEIPGDIRMETLAALSSTYCSLQKSMQSYGCLWVAICGRSARCQYSWGAWSVLESWWCPSRSCTFGS